MPTRIVRLSELSPRRDRDENERTAAARARPVLLDDVELTFDACHRALSYQFHDFFRPGVLVAAITAQGIEGTLWLEATEAPRAGSVGRHTSTDLPVRADGRLSLRQVTVLVWQDRGRTVTRLFDLASTPGLEVVSAPGHSPAGRVRTVEADGPVVLRAGECLLVVLPTGTALPWDTAAPRPWRSFQRAVPVSTAAPPRAARPRPGVAVLSFPHRDGVTAVRELPGPSASGPEPTRAPTEPRLATVLLTGPRASTALELGSSALERGVLLGRDARCHGSELGTEALSRVHAMLVSAGDGIFAVDVGSTNGTWAAGRRVRCHRLGTEELVDLVGLGVRWRLATPAAA